MSIRSQRRRRHKKLARLNRLTEAALRREAARLLAEWIAEARSRARRLSAPAAWSLIGPAIESKALALDPTGDLLADLRRLIAEEVARAAGEPLLTTGKPAAERSRLHR